MQTVPSMCEAVPALLSRQAMCHVQRLLGTEPGGQHEWPIGMNLDSMTVIVQEWPIICRVEQSSRKCMFISRL